MRNVAFKKIQIICILLASTNGAWSQNSNEMIILEDFNQEKHLNWQIVNDGVMGGLSSSSIQIKSEQGLFSGNVSLENNGGFASVRALLDRTNLKKVSKLLIRVKGDGKTYQFRVRTNKRFDGTAYQTFFKTEKDKWTNHVFSAEDFQATFRGMKVPQAPELKLEGIEQIGFLIAGKQQGSFSLIIDWIAMK